ncbi:MAG: flagellar basal body-associated FliL family protein [Alphaproteobacteria bacterium]
MTDQTEATGEVSEGEGEAEGEKSKAKRKFSGKKIVLFIIMPVLLLLMTGAGIYFSGLADPFLGGHEEEKELLAEEETGPSTFYDLPDMLVNLNSTGRKKSYLKISVSLEMASEKDIEHLEQVLPRVIDNFQVYLRELRIEDLRGSAGLQRLREELLLRVVNAVQPAVVRDVLFRELLIQ